MSFQERRTIVSLMSTILIIVAYSAYMIQRYPEADPYAADVFRFWGTYFLILIPVTIVAKIGIYIAFSIINTIATNENEPDITDERDRLIELKANTTSLYIVSIGFALAMVALVMDMPPAVMFIVLLCAGVVADIVSEASQFWFYRRGF